MQTLADILLSMNREELTLYFFNYHDQERLERLKNHFLLTLPINLIDRLIEKTQFSYSELYWLAKNNNTTPEQIAQLYLKQKEIQAFNSEHYHRLNNEISNKLYDLSDIDLIQKLADRPSLSWLLVRNPHTPLELCIKIAEAEISSAKKNKYEFFAFTRFISSMVERLPDMATDVLLEFSLILNEILTSAFVEDNTCLVDIFLENLPQNCIDQIWNKYKTIDFLKDTIVLFKNISSTTLEDSWNTYKPKEENTLYYYFNHLSCTQILRQKVWKKIKKIGREDIILDGKLPKKYLQKFVKKLVIDKSNDITFLKRYYRSISENLNKQNKSILDGFIAAGNLIKD